MSKSGYHPTRVYRWRALRGGSLPRIAGFQPACGQDTHQHCTQVSVHRTADAVLVCPRSDLGYPKNMVSSSVQKALLGWRCLRICACACDALLFA